MAHKILQALIDRPLLPLLAAALALRLWGVSYGLPLFLVNDETPHVYGALKMMELKTLIPALHADEFRDVLYYPPLLSHFYLIVLAPVIAVHYLLSGMPSLNAYRAVLALDPTFLWVAARVWMAAIGVLGIWLTYRIAWYLTASRRAALFAAAFLALSFYHLQLSHNVRHWLPASTLLALFWERALAMRGHGGSPRSWTFLGVALGIATGGVNTAAAVGVIPLVAVRLYGGLRGLFDRRTIAFTAMAALISVAGVALWPYGLTRAEGAPGAVADIAGRFSFLATRSAGGWLSFIGGYVRALFEFETPLSIFAVAGIALLWLRGERFWVGVAAVYSIAFFTLLYLFDDFTARGVVFVTPVLAALAGYAAHSALQVASFAIPSRIARSICCVFIFILAFGWQFAVDIRYQWLLSRPDTRLLAREWLLANLPQNAFVALDSQYLRLPNTPEGARLVAATDPGALRASDRAVMTLGDGAPAGRRHINLALLSSDARHSLAGGTDEFLRSGFTHFVVEYRLADGIREDTRRIVEQGRLIARFGPWRDERLVAVDGSGKLERLDLKDLLALERFGLFVDVYILPPRDPEALALGN